MGDKNAKKLLILAYDFPPYVSVGGLRPFNWYKYMQEFGVYPIVVTRQWSNKHRNHLDYIAPGESSKTIIEETEHGTIIRTPYFPTLSNRLLMKYGKSKFKVLRKVVSGYYEFTQFLFIMGPKSQIYFAAKDYITKNKVDAIIATGDPFILFKYASKLSRKYNIPWIADYRDPWSQYNNFNKIIRFWHSFFEKKYSGTASTITTVSDFLRKVIEAVVPNKTFHIIPNGYDPEVIEKAKGIIQNKENLSIGLAGFILKWHPLESFFRVCANFVKNTNQLKFQINFYGVNIENKIKELLNSNYKELIPFVNIYPKIPHEELMQKLAKENALLLFNYYSYMGTKIFDYLALKRQIILCYSDDTEANKLKAKYYDIEELNSESQQLQADLINETNSGIVVKDADHLSKLLVDLYAEFKNNGNIACNSYGTERFSRKIQVQKLATIIKDMADNNLIS